MKNSFLVVLFFCLIFSGRVFAGDICMSQDTASNVVVELEQKRVLEQEVKEQEALIENLKKQVDLLKQENQLLKEQVQLLKEQKDIYKTLAEEKDKEIKKQKVAGFFEKVKSFLVGAGVGAVVTLVIVH
jgi:TolA-binding protein